MNHAKGRVLLMQTGPLAELLQLMPALSDLQRRRPGLALDWLVDAALAEVPRLHPAVKRVIPLPAGAWHAAWRQGALRQAWADTRALLKAEPLDLVVDLEGRLGLLRWGLQAGAPIVGYARQQLPEPLTALAYRRHSPVALDLPAHARHRCLLAAQLGLPGPDTPPAFGLIPPAAPWPVPAHSTALLAGPAADDPWPDAHWLVLARQAQAARRPVLLLSTDAGSHARAQALAQAITAQSPDGGTGLIHAPQPLGLGALSAVLAQARLLVGRGRDAAWLGGALGLPTLGLLPQAEPAPHQLARLRLLAGTPGQPVALAAAQAALAELLKPVSAAAWAALGAGPISPLPQRQR